MKRLNFFQGVVIFLLIVSVGFGCGYLILYYLAPQNLFSQLLVRSLILLAVGFTSGLICRWTIPSHLWLIKICLGILGTLLSILALDWFYSSPYSLVQKQNLTMAWWSIGEYTQIGLLLLVMLGTALIGRKKAVSLPNPPPQPVQETNANKEKQGPSRKRHLRLKSQSNPIVALQAWTKNISFKGHRNKTKKVAEEKPVVKNTTSVIKVKGLSKTSPVRKKATAKITTKKFTHADNHVKLNGSEDHRCPYCLEEVHKNDPRGVVICPECGTWHHKDCWEITGSCQMAHKHAL